MVSRFILPASNPAFRSVLEHWKSHAPADPDRIKRTLDMALNTGSRT